MTTENIRTLLVVAVLSLLVVALSYAGQAAALYPPNGAKPDGVGGYMNPDDGMCVVGVKPDGTMLVDFSITNARDCVAWTKSADDVVNLVGMTTQASCINATGVAPNDGYRHARSTSLCYDTTNSVGISRVDLDNTDAMCFSKGGTVVTSGKCVAYGWVYRNRKSDNSLPVSPTVGSTPYPGSAILYTTDGVQSTDGLGFCFTGIRMTGGTYAAPVLPAVVGTSCPSYHNTPGVCVGGTSVGAGCTSNSNCSGGGTCNLGNFGPGLEWQPCGSSTTGCQTQASYDAGLGWSWDATNSRCVYAFGVNGPLNANVTNAAGAVTNAGTVTPADLSTITNQGDCLAAGYSWDNWLPFPTTGGGGYRTTTPGTDYAGMPATARIVKLDAITPVEGGGGEFFSGTGFNCLKCHADQSRAYQERDKPGFVKTRHQKAGDDPSKPFAGYFTAGSSSWGLPGVQCTMCHSTAKPAQDDLIQVVPAGVTGPPAAGAPKSATGHNQTEYGAHLLDICYTCHGSAANPTTTNPASVIPVSGGDFALTSNLPGPPTSNLGNANCTAPGVPSACCTGPGSGTCTPPPNTAGLAPIMNQFLNSPHAEYNGDSLKVSIGNKSNYSSTFEGYVCRTAATQFRTSAPPGDSQTNCLAANLTWYTTTGFGNFCYYNSASCTAQNATGQWLTTFDTTAYAWAAAVGGPGGLCVGTGIGSIITTVYRNGSAEKIPNLDSTTNAACTDAGNGSATSGASGFWVKDGETSPGSPTDTAQGNCMTCHDVHWALADPAPEAEPFRRECTTCHSHPAGEPSASGAPQVDLLTINHLGGAGTPLEDALADPDSACETCHMPKSSAAGSFMHLWRINTDPAYQTMGATKANTTPDGEAWVDLEHACGQCHGGGTVQDAQHKSKVSLCTAPGVPEACCSGPGTGTCAMYRTNAQLAPIANGMHASAGVTYPTTFSTVTNGLKVNMYASVSCNGCSPTCEWTCGDGVTAQVGADTCNDASCTYGGPGTKSITLDAMLNGGQVGTSTRFVTLSAPPAAPPVPGGLGGAGCPSLTFNANTWTASFTDASTPSNARVLVEWGDGNVDAMPPGSTFSHTYRAGGAYLMLQKVVSSTPQLAVAPPCTVTAATFQLAGNVKKKVCAGGGTNDGATCTTDAACTGGGTCSDTAGLGSATVSVRSSTTGATVRTVYTAMNGFFSVASLKPDTYWLIVTKRGYTFNVPADTETVGPSHMSVNIVATGSPSP